MAKHNKYQFRLQLDMSQELGEVWMHVDQGAGSSELGAFIGTSVPAVKTLNNAMGDELNGISLGVDPDRPSQAIFHSFDPSAKGMHFEIIVPKADQGGVLGIALLSSKTEADLPTTDSQRPTAFGWIQWDSNGNFTSSDTIQGSGAGGVPDTGFSGTMSWNG